MAEAEPIAYVPGKQLVPTDEQLATWSITGEPNERAAGPCPACGDEFGVEIVVDIVADGPFESANAARPANQRATRKFECACMGEHKGRTDGKSGCGRWWLAAIERRESDSQLILVRAPDQRLTNAAIALQEAAATESTRVRAWGEKWLPIVSALYLILGIGGFVLNLDAIAGLPIAGKLVLVLLAGVSVYAMGRGLFNGYAAAYGWLKHTDVSDDAKLTAWYEDRRKALVGAPTLMRKAIVNAIAALATLGLAAVILVFWPGAGAPKPIVQVAFNDAGDAAKPGSYCGSLVESKDGQVSVKVTDGATTSTKSTPAAWITGVTPKEEC